MTGDNGATGGDRLAISGDELAGVVDLFGGLTRVELESALSELAFKRGVDPPTAAVVDAAVGAYALVETDAGGPESLLVPGPAAFPTLPDGAADLPHILDVEERDVGGEPLARSVERQFRREVARAVNDGDRARIERLQDLSYDLEAWGPVELDRLRERLDDALAAQAEE